MAAAVSKIMRNQDLILAAKKCRVVTRFRNTIGLPGTMAVRLQPNHPTDDPDGIAATRGEGLLYGCGDAVIGINPASDSPAVLARLCHLLDEVITRHAIPTQACVLTHATTSIGLIEAGVPVDLVFQSIAGTEAANASFGVTLGLLAEAHDAGRSLKRGTVGSNVMYFETGQGSALSAGAHHGVDQQTLEARAYAVARAYEPLLVNTVVGFIGPEYLYDGKQIIRAGLEDHFCGKLMGLPLGCDVCYTNHAEADADDMDALMTLLGAAGVTFIMGIPGSRRRHAELPVDVVPRPALPARHARPEARAGIRGLAAGAWASPGPTGGCARPPPTHPLLSRATRRMSAPPDLPARSGHADPWTDLARRDAGAAGARPRPGASLPTREVLNLGLAHAQARDAVHAAMDVEALAAGIWRSSDRPGLPSTAPRRTAPPIFDGPISAAVSRRSSRTTIPAPEPGGRSISPSSWRTDSRRPRSTATPCPCWQALLPRLAGRSLAPIVLARQARVALGDEIGALLGARMVVMLIGERPGLSAADSLGAYLTFAPRDRTDRCEPQLRVEHPRRRPRTGGGRGQDRLAGRPRLCAVADRRGPQG